MQTIPTEKEYEASVQSFRLAYQLLERFSQVLDTAERALRALNSVISLATITNSHSPDQRSSPLCQAEQAPAVDLNFNVPETIDFFDPTSWQIDDIPLDVVALISSMGENPVDDTALGGNPEQSPAPDSYIWDCEYGVASTIMNV